VNGRGLLTGAGAVVLLGAAVALPTAVAPALETVPADPDVTTVLEAPQARILDVDTQRTVTRDLLLTSHTAGFAAGGEPPDGVALWATNARITSTDGVVRSDTWEIQAFDARTGEASGCCEGFRITADGHSEPVRRAGILLKFPFGTEPHDYQVWDAALGDTVTARFQGDAEVDGVAAYRFTVTVPPTDVGSTEVPSSILGIDSIAEVTVRQVYSGDRTVWVEPATGGILDVRQHLRQTLVGDGREVVGLDATFVLGERSREDSVRQLRRGVHLARMHDTYPLALGAGGVGLLGLAWLRRRRGRPSV
jgi:DUF3068 family protein